MFYAKWRLWVYGILLLFFLSACKPKVSSDLEIVYAKEPCQIESGGTMEFSLKGELEDAEITWEVARGEITSTSGSTIAMYIAPDVVEDTTVFINVTVTTGPKKVPVSITCDIIGTAITQETVNTTGEIPTSTIEPTLLSAPSSPTNTPPHPTTSPVTNTPEAIQNLVRNPGFEEDFNATWMSEGKIEAYQSTESFKGQYALCFTQKSTEENLWAIIEQVVNVEENTYYKFTAEISSTDVTEFHLRVDWLRDGNPIKQEQVGSAYSGDTDGWNSIGGNLNIAPDSATHAVLKLIHGLRNGEQPVTGSTVCVDEVVFVASVISQSLGALQSDEQQLKCEWIKANFPQTISAIAQTYGVPENRITLLFEGCDDIVMGFQIGSGAVIELKVPDGGCIDAPSDAVFTGDYSPIPSADGVRAYSGIVRAEILTYRPWCK